MRKGGTFLVHFTLQVDVTLHLDDYIIPAQAEDHGRSREGGGVLQ